MNQFNKQTNTQNKKVIHTEKLNSILVWMLETFAPSENVFIILLPTF